MEDTYAASDSTERLLPGPDSVSRRFDSYVERLCRLIIAYLAGVLAFVAFAILIFSSAYAYEPGPLNIYSHFAAIPMSVCLIFQCGQLVILQGRKTQRTSQFELTFRWIYWTVLVLTTFIAGVGWTVSGKPDSTAVQFLAFVASLAGIGLLLYQQFKHTDKAIYSLPSWYLQTARGFNYFFRIIHVLFSILFAIGAITLATQFQYQNPGQLYNISLEDGRIMALSIYCTGPPSTSVPTLWFESSPAHGIVDFLGVQSYLAAIHGRQSCSYDHPNFGWSGRAPKDFTNSSMYWNSMLKVLGRQDEPYVGIGWGGGGEDILSHALESPSTTKGVIFLDTSPDGIEWMDAARENGWDEARMLAQRQQDLADRLSLVRTILALAIPWGLMPIFVPSNSTTYFDAKLYARFHAQALKDDFWAMQYYALIQMRAQANVSTYLTDTVLPASIPVYAVLTNNSHTTASDVFYSSQKRAMVEHIAGGKGMVKGWASCSDSDCDLGFPVTKAKWTADTLVALGM